MNVLVNSFGGCGSKFFTKQLKKNGVIDSLSKTHVHIRNPKNLKNIDSRKVVFIYDDPIAAVVSFFNRRIFNSKQHGFSMSEGVGNPGWARKHCQNLDGDWEQLSAEWNLESFLKNGVDLFHLEEFFLNWYESGGNENVLFIDFNSLWDPKINTEIANFLEVENQPLTFEPRLPRTSSSCDLNSLEVRLIQDIYGDFSRRLKAMSTCFIK